MPDQPTPHKTLEGEVRFAPDASALTGRWLIGGSDLTGLLFSLVGQRLRISLEVLDDGG